MRGRSKVLILITAAFATFYAWSVGATVAWLLFPPKGAFCATGAVWALMGMAIYFAPPGLILAALQLRLRRGNVTLGWRRLSEGNVVLLALTMFANLLVLVPG